MHLYKCGLKGETCVTSTEDQKILIPAPSNLQPNHMPQLEILSPNALCLVHLS